MSLNLDAQNCSFSNNHSGTLFVGNIFQGGSVNSGGKLLHVAEEDLLIQRYLADTRCQAPMEGEKRKKKSNY